MVADPPISSTALLCDRRSGFLAVIILHLASTSSDSGELVLCPHELSAFPCSLVLLLGKYSRFLLSRIGGVQFLSLESRFVAKQVVMVYSTGP